MKLRARSAIVGPAVPAALLFGVGTAPASRYEATTDRHDGFVPGVERCR